jgi:predicted nucleic acid-binding protein
MHKIISNTSCIIVLDNINLLYILKELYGKIYITEEVLKEYGKPVGDWVIVNKVKNSNYTKILNTILDLGESSTIALSLELDNNTMILDDLKARKVVKEMNLSITGTLGVIVKAKQKGIIKSISAVLDKLKQQNFRISKDLENKLMKYDIQ